MLQQFKVYILNIKIFNRIVLLNVITLLQTDRKTNLLFTLQTYYLDYTQRLAIHSGVSIEKSSKFSALLIMYEYKIIFSISGFKYDLFESNTRGSAYEIKLPYSNNGFRKSFPLLRYIKLWNL